MKRIFLYRATDDAKMHSLYRQMIKYPPKGYKFVLPEKTIKISFLSYVLNSKFFKKLYAFLRIKYLLNTWKVYSKLSSSEIPRNVDLLLAGTTVEEDLPYILDIPDNPFLIRGWNYNLFIKDLESINDELKKEKCKAIIVPFKNCYELCKKYFGKEAMEKVMIIHHGVFPRKYIKRKIEKIRFLFVGSIANPDDFLIKGGIETIESFLRLHEKFGEQVELIIKCKIPKWIYNKYNLGNLNCIKIIEKTISKKELENLYKSCHIFLTPSHVEIAMAPLEAMNHSLLLIGLNVYGINEYIRHDINGLLIKPSDKIPYNRPDYLTIVRTNRFLKNIINPDKRVINDLFFNMKKFVENKTLINKFGKESFKLLKKEFSIETRNKKLKKLFDKAL